MIIIELWFDWLPPAPIVGIGAQNGYSVFSFAILYLMARAIRLYGLPQWFKKNSFLIYVGCSLILGLGAYIGAKYGVAANGWYFAYINPIVIISSVAFLMMFERLNITSKFINHLAKSTLAVLLGHSAIFFLYTKHFKYIYDHFSGIQVVGYWALAIIIVFWASIAIDQIRLLLYKPIEKLMNKYIKNNEIIPIENKS